jgi:putative protease
LAHLYDARVYVALNTILTDEELITAERLIRQIYDAGADALIIQDMGITQLDIPPIPLHASTQTDNCTPAKVEFLSKAGFNRIILARELTLDEIQTISESVPDATLEAFVHGSLCVSYSGRCYLSAALYGRSANRGECAQCCRLPYSLTDADEKMIVKQKHLLSLKDMNRSDDLETLIQAGVSSLKIEGRLKDVSYVKNITAYYRQKLDALFDKNPAYYRSSAGHSTYTFEPRPEKSFNRGFTSYLLHGRDMNMTSFDTPKSIGEPVGVVRRGKACLATTNNFPLHNGDGLVFFNSKGELEGFRVNRVEENRIYPKEMPYIQPDTFIYRNYDHVFEMLLSKPSAERKIGVTMEWGDYPDGFTLTMTDETNAKVIIVRPFAKETARKPQDDTIRTQLGKLGNTMFVVTDIIISTSGDFFVPSSLLNEMRREAIERLMALRRIRYVHDYVKKDRYETDIAYPQKTLDYSANISNRKAKEFYEKHEVEVTEPAFEIKIRHDVPLMTTKHCLLYSMGWCPVHHQGKSPYKEPYFLIYKDIRLQLSFDCKKCRMYVSISPDN